MHSRITTDRRLPVSCSRPFMHSRKLFPERSYSSSRAASSRSACEEMEMMMKSLCSTASSRSVVSLTESGKVR